MRIAAEGGSVPPAVPEAVARVLEFSQVARAGALSLILGALRAAELTAGIARLGPRLPEPVIEQVITHDQDAVRGHDAAPRRLRSRAEPAIDRALFGRLEHSGIAWVRSAILRDRIGPGGEPIVPPDLRAKPAAFVRTAGLPLSPEHLADTDTGDAALELLEKRGTPWEQLTHFVQNMGDARVYRLAAAAQTVERLHFLLKKVGKYLGPDTSALLRGRLAEAAGPEPVWDVAVMAAGAAENASPSVRASMAAGDVGPLLMAVERVAHQHLPGVTVPDPDELCAPHPDDPVSRPLENAVRQHLDNSPDRWRIMVRRLMEAGPLEYAQLVDLVQAVGGGAGEAAEGEP